MKRAFILIFSLTLLACAEKNADYGDESEHNPKTLPSDSVDETSEAEILSNEKFGDKISKENAVPAHTVPALMQKQDSLHVKIRGEIVEVCQKKGCWMMMNVGQDEKMRITFRNYAFFVPKNISGKYATVEGTVKREITDVETLKHYATDAGNSLNEVEAIDEPADSLVFVADGVIIEEI